MKQGMTLLMYCKDAAARLVNQPNLTMLNLQVELANMYQQGAIDALADEVARCAVMRQKLAVLVGERVL